MGLGLFSSALPASPSIRNLASAYSCCLCERVDFLHEHEGLMKDDRIIGWEEHCYYSLTSAHPTNKRKVG